MPPEPAGWPTLDPAFIAAVNARFAGEAVLLAQAAAPPVPRDRGPAALDPAIMQAQAGWAERIAADNRPNEPHALLIGDQLTPQAADYAVIDFATVCAIRETGRWPPLLSAGALAVCRGRGQVLLQRRSAWVSTYQGCLDIIGGAFQPPAAGHPGDPSLAATIAREFAEETGLALDPGRRAPAVIAGQLRSGFSGYVELGLDVAPDALDRAASTQEGTLEPMDAAGLAAALNDPQERWVPTARMHVLTWLALGAHAHGAADLGPVFAPDLAQTLLRRLIG